MERESYGASTPPYCWHKGLGNSFVAPCSGDSRLARLVKRYGPKVSSGRGVSRRRAPVPAFRQAVAAVGMQFALA
uniref:Uncharacterized protein LOC104213478 isoform X2 n=1 Tax=Nicotiana sylvestris TaxID=4096 RepID=A0A1U7VG29_NICSY|nr:PREDICTED: uncharacterized protein LOC104213478 isoform X2 [Nicotiana sylvestris]